MTIKVLRCVDSKCHFVPVFDAWQVTAMFFTLVPAMVDSRMRNFPVTVTIVAWPDIV